jgi:hypothetical protein
MVPEYDEVHFKKSGIGGVPRMPCNARPVPARFRRASGNDD